MSSFISCCFQNSEFVLDFWEFEVIFFQVCWFYLLFNWTLFESCYSIFNFLYCIFKFQNWFCSFSIIFLCRASNFVLTLFSWDYFFVYMCSLETHQTSLKQLFSIFSWISISLWKDSGKLWSYFEVSCFLAFSFFSWLCLNVYAFNEIAVFFSLLDWLWHRKTFIWRWLLGHCAGGCSIFGS